MSSSLSLYRMLLLMCAFFIFTFGLVMIFSTTSAEILDQDLLKNTNQALLRQITYAMVGAAIGYMAWCYGYGSILRCSPYLLSFFTVLLILTLIPGIGKEVNGSRRWLGVAGLSFQPSEFVKYLVPACFIHYAIKYQPVLDSFRNFLKLVSLISIPIFLVLIEPNNGTTAVMGVTLLILFWLMRIRFRFWALPLLIALCVGGLFAYHSPYVSGRIKVYLDPSSDIKGKGHQPYQAKIAAGSGELFGKGPGNSLQKLSYLPEAQNDYIAAIFAEEFGFLGILCLVIVYMAFAFIGFILSMHSLDKAGFYYGSAITFLIAFQAFLNLGVVSGLLPTTGLNLPLFSQGGSSLMANLMGIGLLLSIAKPHGQYEYS